MRDGVRFVRPEPLLMLAVVLVIASIVVGAVRRATSPPTPATAEAADAGR